jgi:glyoxylase-like metal-dependent hydrolase (beta-lactamase superfamily II)
MKVTKLSPYAWQLTHFGLMNCYLVREDALIGEPTDTFTLIDTTLGAAKPIFATAKALDLPIARILLTHAHMDHIGSLDALAPQLGSIAVAISHRESPLLPKPPTQDLSPLPGEPPCALKGDFPGALTPATHLLTDGELFGSLRCIATPGHTPGHFSFLDERDGTLYTGDAMVTVGGKPHIPGFGPWFFPFPKFATWDRPTSVASIQRLLTLPLATPIQRLAPGHGPVLTGGTDLLKAALTKTK